ncbi:MAG: hypothetical protein ACUVQZ_08710 [Candidatus Caldatribacteriaceae bacterium]
MKKLIIRLRGIVALLMLFWIFFMVTTGGILFFANQGMSISYRTWKTVQLLHPPFGFAMFVLGLIHFSLNVTLFRSDLKILFGVKKTFKKEE